MLPPLYDQSGAMRELYSAGSWLMGIVLPGWLVGDPVSIQYHSRHHAAYGESSLIFDK